MPQVHQGQRHRAGVCYSDLAALGGCTLTRTQELPWQIDKQQSQEEHMYRLAALPSVRPFQSTCCASHSSSSGGGAARAANSIQTQLHHHTRPAVHAGSVHTQVSGAHHRGSTRASTGQQSRAEQPGRTPETRYNTLVRSPHAQGGAECLLLRNLNPGVHRCTEKSITLWCSAGGECTTSDHAHSRACQHFCGLHALTPRAYERPHAWPCRHAAASACSHTVSMKVEEPWP
jgi:hypothetical protein